MTKPIHLRWPDQYATRARFWMPKSAPHAVAVTFETALDVTLGELIVKLMALSCRDQELSPRAYAALLALKNELDLQQ